MPLLTVIQLNIEIMLVILCLVIWILTTVWSKDRLHAGRNIWIIDIFTVGLLISDILAIYYRGNTSQLGYYMVRIGNFFNFFFLYLMPIYFSFIIELLFKRLDKGKKRISCARILTGIALITNFVNLIVPFVYDFDVQNRYYRKSGWYVNAALIMIAIIIIASLVWQHRKEIEKEMFWMLFIDILMPLIASVVQLFVYGIAITNIAIGITQILLFMVMFRYQEETIRKRDMELSEYNAKLMLTQVQPHFMLNTLSTIQYLCKTDSQAAIDTITDFAIYLRNNMEFASSTKMIPFEKELSHIEKYISIEQKRFGERIKVVYDIKESDFELPALSIQPLVENAVKHGISKKRGGGTIELSTIRCEDKICITIKDDGIGYDMNQPFSSDRVHMGLKIVTDRLKRMCNGQVKIESEKNKGTICEIEIPIEFN